MKQANSDYWKQGTKSLKSFIYFKRFLFEVPPPNEDFRLVFPPLFVPEIFLFFFLHSLQYQEALSGGGIKIPTQLLKIKKTFFLITWT